MIAYRLSLIAYCLLLLASGCKSIVRERPPAPKVLSDGTGVVFTYDNLSASEVHLAGEFNQWGPNDGGKIRRGDRKNLAFKRREDNLWIAVIPFKEHVRNPQYDHLDDDVYVEHGNRYKYKLVIDGSNWEKDPSNRSIARDPDGNENSLLVVP